MNAALLIVDDEEELLDIYQDFFQAEGFQVYTAPSAEKGLEIYGAHPEIKLVISDSNMKGMKGLEFFSILKTTYAEAMPFFYLSTGDIKQSENELQKKGVHRLLSKPFDFDVILEKVKNDLA